MGDDDEDEGIYSLGDPISGKFDGPGGPGSLDLHEWDMLTSHGCAGCGHDFMPDDQEDILWLNWQTPLCQECADEKYPHLGAVNR